MFFKNWFPIFLLAYSLQCGESNTGQVIKKEVKSVLEEMVQLLESGSGRATKMATDIQHQIKVFYNAVNNYWNSKDCQALLSELKNMALVLAEVAVKVSAARKELAEDSAEYSACVQLGDRLLAMACLLKESAEFIQEARDFLDEAGPSHTRLERVGTVVVEKFQACFGSSKQHVMASSKPI